jgi:uncharacterized membrane protein YdfJ with MMPL/SSD domain
VAEFRDTSSGASQPLTLLFLACWIVLIAVLGFFVLTERSAASTSAQTKQSDVSMSAVAQQSRRSKRIPDVPES